MSNLSGRAMSNPYELNPLPLSANLYENCVEGSSRVHRPSRCLFNKGGLGGVRINSPFTFCFGFYTIDGYLFRRTVMPSRNLSFLGFPYYKVGANGVVWSRNSRNGKTGPTKDWRRMNPATVGYGYYCVTLCHGREKRESYYVHQL